MNSSVLIRVVFFVIVTIFVLNFVILLVYFPLQPSSSSFIAALSSLPLKKKNLQPIAKPHENIIRKKLRQNRQLPPLEVGVGRKDQGQRGQEGKTTTKATSGTVAATNKTNENRCQAYGCPIYPPELTIPSTNQNILGVLETSGYVEPPTRSKAKPPQSDFRLDFASGSFATLSQQGKSHSVNQDRAVFVSPFVPDLLSLILPPNSPTKSFLACIFDGHGRLGHKVAQEVVETFPQLLSKKLTLVFSGNTKHVVDDKRMIIGNSNNSTSNTNQTILVKIEDFDVTDLAIREALNETFLEVNEKGTASSFLFGGCTASVALRFGSRLYVANAGDSETIVVSASSSSKQHKLQKQQQNSLSASVKYETRRDKANQPGERARIENLGGKIHINAQGFDPRVVVHSKAANDTIALAMSRSIGDWEWKAVGVTAEPTIDLIDLSSISGPDTIVFLLAASDGFWDMRQKHFYATQMAASFTKGNKNNRVPVGEDDDPDARFRPLYHLYDIIQRITPKVQKGYRDDITATIVNLG